MRGRLIDYVDDLVSEVAADARSDGAETPAILMAHYTVQGAVFGGYGKGGLLAPDVELPLSAVKNQAFDYMALAHIHQHQTIPNNDVTGQPPVIYPGSIERVDFGEEREDKVAILADVARGHTAWRTVPLPARPFLTLRVEGSEVEPLESAVARDRGTGPHPGRGGAGVLFPAARPAEPAGAGAAGMPWRAPVTSPASGAMPPHRAAALASAP